MTDHLVQAAACLRCGDHRGAAEALRELELGDASRAFQIAVESLSSPCTTEDNVYVRFVALKVVTYALTRYAGDRKQQSSTAVPFLLDYGYRLAEQAESHAWLPVVSELATAMAVALKLGCVDDLLEVHAAEVEVLLAGLMDLVQVHFPSHKAFLHRVICQSTVEEFGLFSGVSRYRGLPVRVHRRCRELFSSDGRLPLLIQAIFRSLLALSAESEMSVDRGLTALVSCFAWPSHQFFEEDSSTEESCGVFYVSHPEWERLLVGTVPLHTDAASASAAVFTVHDVLREWYGSGAVKGVAVDRQKLVEMIQLLCAFKGSQWGEEGSIRFLASSLTLCLDVFEHLTGCATERELHLFPLLATAVLRLVSNYVEFFFFPPAQPLITRLASLTCFLIRRCNTSSGDDPDVMSCVDEMLSVWYHLTSYIDRNSFSAHNSKSCAQRHLISEGCQHIFSTYMAVKVSVDAVELEDDYFSESFTSSHLHLVAQVGRICASYTCELLIHSTQTLQASLANSLSAAAVPSPLFEALWTLLRIIGFFIADPVEGEQPYIPRCFLEMGAENNSLLLQLMTAVNALLPLLQSPVAASSAVQAAFLDILTHYIRTYVENDETCPLYAGAFDEGAKVVDLALVAVTGALQVSPFEEDATGAACRLLDCIADKSGSVRIFCEAQSSFQQLTQAAQQIHRFRFHGHTRGRIIAFILACSPDASTVQTRLNEFTLSPSSNDDVNLVLEILSSLAGMFESLHSQQVIRGSFPGLLAVGQQLIHVSTSKFYEREIALESVQFARSMFVACAPLLDDDSIRALLGLVVSELRYSVQAVRTSNTWTSAEGENDKADYMIGVAKLLSSLAQWKALDCFLPDDDTRALSASTVETAGELLRHMDERSLSLPSLEDSLFSCMEVCAESFTADFVFSSSSDAFLSAMLYALNSERVNIQRAGISVTACVAAFLEASTPQANHASACADLLKVVLRALTSGKVFFNNLQQISRALLILTRGVSPGTLLHLMESLAGEVPHSAAFLQTIFPALQSAASHSTTNDAQFEELVQDALSSVRGTSIIGA
ncbi:hypothetical protein ABB37_04912 [Leptomonas pyrrhocoris]|uniref:Exportin-1/Importin-beta-like domain-containing protein n=1 Tax=Leptomonas pyrrhocoris TaxID=157538 RepID=A0A0M9G0Q5_LEPPY|nr:hypothetical protein ABB37_04912 [Leptomonas pyrrhocoris]KPA79817.1 hypothetical protein ABB37_04912 [Leptomonas pyrrhocoris]|eukprot:XP_015658256.1 hypothetical protein ABB37_04912 [Leptomonas pyrrhocoris]